MVDLLNKKVKHIALGVGTVTQQDDKYITVEFSAKTSKFVYPTAFDKFLKPEDQSVMDAINKEITAAKSAEQAAMAAKKATEEQARLEALKAQAAACGKKSGPAKTHTPLKRLACQVYTYLVFQGDTYNEECKGQFIWAPKYTKGGKTCHHWDRLLDLREGDVIFHCSGGYIQAISMAKGSYEESARPDHTTGDWSKWEKDGRRVDCYYHVLKVPIKHGTYKETIMKYCNVKYSPFDKAGNGNMGYLFELNLQLAMFFIKEIAKKNPEVVDLDFIKLLPVKSGVNKNS